MTDKTPQEVIGEFFKRSGYPKTANQLIAMLEHAGYRLITQDDFDEYKRLLAWRKE